MLLRRLVPWLIVFEVLRAGRDHWGRLDPGDRGRVSELMRRTHGNPGNLTRADRAELLDLGAACASAAWASRWPRRPPSGAGVTGAGRGSLGAVPRSTALRADQVGRPLRRPRGGARALGEAHAGRARAPGRADAQVARRLGNLTPGERRDVRRLVAKLDLPTLGRNLAPVARRLRPGGADPRVDSRPRCQPAGPDPLRALRGRASDRRAVAASGLHHPEPEGTAPRTTRSRSRRPTSPARCTWATPSTARSRTR